MYPKFHSFFLTLLISAGVSQNISGIIHENELDMDNVKEAGRLLMDHGIGFVKIESNSKSDDTCVVTIHGYESRGYEWVVPLSGLAQRFGNSYFYRYDWDSCPDTISKNFSHDMSLLLDTKPKPSVLILFAHSYGGVILTLSLKSLVNPGSVNAHVIASPLAGYPRLTDACRNEDITEQYEWDTWSENIRFYQWRTQHKSDGAFNHLKKDPQLISIPGSQVVTLPDTMDGHRLGHNWSITWVMRQFLNSND